MSTTTIIVGLLCLFVGVLIGALIVSLGTVARLGDERERERRLRDAAKRQEEDE